MAWKGILVCCLLLLTAAPVSAQQDEPVLTDDTDDVEIDAQGSGNGDPTGQLGQLDLVSADLVETEETFDLTLQVKDMDPPAPNAPDISGRVEMFFWHGDTEFRVGFYQCSFCQGAGKYGTVSSRPEGAAEWSRIEGSLPGTDGFEVDESSATYSWSLERDWLLDSMGAAPFPGRELHGFWAHSALFSDDAELNLGDAVNQPMNVVDAADRMPESGTSDARVPVTFGLQQTGDLVLSSDEPFRASNGEATTFLYEVNATNVGERAHLVTFNAVGAPAQWDVDFPVPSIVVEPGEWTLVPVLVRTPFAHIHGGAQAFTVQAQDPENTGHIGRVELGIRYLEVPQPAGHHDTVYFHSFASDSQNPFSVAFGGPSLAMNTVEDDTLDTDEAVPARVSGGQDSFIGTTAFYRWTLPLDPALRLGLDFDLDGEGTIELPIESDVPLTSFTVHGSLQVRRPDGEIEDGFRDRTRWEATEVATFDTEPADLSGSDTLEAAIVPTEDGDLIPYDAGNQMVLYLYAQAEQPQTVASQTLPRLAPGGSMRLPLFEYHDPIESAFQSLTAPSLQVLGDATRMANPGDLIRFLAEVEDPGNVKTGDYRLQLTGANTEWAELPLGDRLKVDSGDRQVVQVLVDIPPTAKTGDQADLFLHIKHAQDASQRSLVRLLVDVDDSMDHEDDRLAVMGEQGEVQESPAPLAFLALAAVALLRRRR